MPAQKLFYWANASKCALMLRVALMNVAHGYTENLVFQIIKSMVDIEIKTPQNAQLIIKGPYKEKNKFEKLKNKLASKNAVVLFDSAENTRYRDVKADYYITHDLGVSDPRHIRVPHWYNVIDWRHEGLPELGEIKRFGRSISIDELMAPRSVNSFTEREEAAVIFAGHLREPRGLIIEAVKKQMKVVGYGRAFDTKIHNHNESGIQKMDILRQYKFNICPENSLGVGYYTEKVVEAYAAGCIPVYWSDHNVSYDFNEKAFINATNHVAENGYKFPNLKKEKIQRKIFDQPLLQKKPQLASVINFLDKVVKKSRGK